MSINTSNTEYRDALAKVLRRLNKAEAALGVAMQMTELRTPDFYRLRAAEYCLALVYDCIETNVGATARIGGEGAKAEWMQSEFRQGFDAAMDVLGEFLRSLEVAEDDDEREAAVDRIFDERDRLTAERPCCKMGVCGKRKRKGDETTSTDERADNNREARRGRGQ